jgi:hypothetical protein
MTPENYVWCSEKLGADSGKKRRKRQIASVSTQQCVKVDDIGVLESVSCLQTHRFICEVIQGYNKSNQIATNYKAIFGFFGHSSILISECRNISNIPRGFLF